MGADELAYKVSRPVDYVRYRFYNSISVSYFFAQVIIFYRMRKILGPSLICSIDDTGFTPGRNLNYKKRTLVVAATDTRAVILCPQF